MAGQRGIKPPLMYLPRRKKLPVIAEDTSCGLSCAGPVTIKFEGLSACPIVISGDPNGTYTLPSEGQIAPAFPGSCLWGRDFQSVVIVLDLDGPIPFYLSVGMACNPGEFDNGVGIALVAFSGGGNDFAVFGADLSVSTDNVVFCGPQPGYEGVFTGGTVTIL